MATSMLARQRCSFARAAPQKAPRMVAVVARAQQQQQQPLQQVQLASIAKPALVTAVANIIMALPASAEAGKLFDFDLTLPVMASEFLLLMVFLDKAWFGPVGRVLDERDKLIRDKLASVRDNAGDTDSLLAEAEAVVRQARADVSQLVNKQKAEKQAELDAAYAKAKSKINDEVNAAIANMDKESGAMLKTLDAQVDKIANEVLRRVLPDGVKV